MSFWKKLSRKKMQEFRRIIPREEYRRLVIQIKEAAESGDYNLILSIATNTLSRFDPKTIHFHLNEAKKSQEPVCIFLDASEVSRRKVIYCGGNDLKQRLPLLIVADYNLHCYSQFHRLAGDALYNQSRFDMAVDHYFTVLRFRPRYTYLIAGGRKREDLTPPELEGFAWPQIHDQKDRKMRNMRIATSFFTDAQILARLYSRLGRCLHKSHQDYIKAEQAFAISLWFLERLESKARTSSISEVQFEKGRFSLKQSHINEGKIPPNLSRPIASTLEEILISIEETHLKRKRIQPYTKYLEQALEISKKIEKDEIVNRIEEILSEMSTSHARNPVSTL